MLTDKQVKPIAKAIKENIGKQKFVFMVIDLEKRHLKNNASVISNLPPDEISFFLNEFLDETSQLTKNNVTTFNPKDL